MKRDAAFIREIFNARRAREKPSSSAGASQNDRAPRRHAVVIWWRNEWPVCTPRTSRPLSSTCTRIVGGIKARERRRFGRRLLPRQNTPRPTAIIYYHTGLNLLFSRLLRPSSRHSTLADAFRNVLLSLQFERYVFGTRAIRVSRDGGWRRIRIHIPSLAVRLLILSGAPSGLLAYACTRSLVRHIRDYPEREDPLTVYLAVRNPLMHRVCIEKSGEGLSFTFLRWLPSLGRCTYSASTVREKER